MRGIACVAAAVLAGAALAADVEWTGAAGDGLWTSAGNWKGDAVPGDGDRAKFTASPTVRVESDVSVGGVVIADGQSPVFLGGGSITSVGGSVAGGKGARFAVPVAFAENVDAIASSANQYGSTIVFDGGLSGGASVTSGGNVNYGVKFTNAAVSVPAVTINCSAQLAAPFQVKTLTLTDTWTDGNGNSPNVSLHPGFGVAPTSELVTGIGVPTLNFTNEDAPGPALFSVPSLRVGAGGRPTLACACFGGTNLVRIGAFSREPGSLVRIRNDRRMPEAFVPGENAGFVVPGMPADGRGLCPAWVCSDSFRVRKLPNNALAALTLDDYAAVGGELALNDPSGLYRLNRPENVLTADSEIDSILFQQGGASTQTLDLASHDLVVRSGSVASRDWASKALVSSAGGRLVFGGEALVLNLTYDVPHLGLAAPLAWRRPAGSAVDRPDLLIPTYGGAEFVIDGEDQVGDWGGLFAEGRGKGGSLLVFGGPSDRTFHGAVGGRFWLRKRGSGTLTFAGPDRTRGRQIRVEGGTVVIAHDDAPSIDMVTNGAVVRVGRSVAWTRFAKVYEGGVLEGSGTILTGHTHNNLFDGCILRGGTAKAPGTLTFASQVTFPTNIVLDVGFSGDAHGQVVAGKQAFRKGLDTVVRVRLSDVDGTACIRPSETNVVYSWTGPTENFNASRISFVVENGTPRRLDATSAVVLADGPKKAISVTGIRSARGMTVVVR